MATRLKISNLQIETVKKDIKNIQQRLEQQYGEDGKSQINFKDQISNITISKIKKQNKRLYVSWGEY